MPGDIAVVSPYLKRPMRRLEDALRECGLSASDIGWLNGESDAPPTQDGDDMSRPSDWTDRTLPAIRRRGERPVGGAGYSMVVGAAACVALATVLSVALWTSVIEREPPLTERMIDDLRDIAPAAGPDPSNAHPNSAAPIPNGGSLPDWALDTAPTLAPLDSSKPVTPR